MNKKGTDRKSKKHKKEKNRELHKINIKILAYTCVLFIFILLSIVLKRIWIVMIPMFIYSFIDKDDEV